MSEIIVTEKAASEELYSQLEAEGIGYQEVSRGRFLDELVSGEYSGVVGDNEDNFYAAAVEYDSDLPVFDYGGSVLATSLLSGENDADVRRIDQITDMYSEAREKENLEVNVDTMKSLISHDTRNEMNVLLGRLSLARDIAEDKVIEQLDVVDGCARSIQDIVDGAGALLTDDVSEKVHVSNIVERVASSYRGESTKRGFELQEDLEPGLYALAGEEIATIYGQMIRNSFEHSEGDKIRISAYENGEGPRVDYEDNGVGIDEELRENVLEEGVSSTEEGGLGMFILSEIAEKYDMDLEIEESEDLGGVKISTLLEPAEQ